MTEPQLSIRSARARKLAHALARRTGMTTSKLVERALEHYDSELRQGKNRHPIDVVWELAAEQRGNVPADASSGHDDLYDEHGLPR